MKNLYFKKATAERTIKLEENRNAYTDKAKNNEENENGLHK